MNKASSKFCILSGYWLGRNGARPLALSFFYPAILLFSVCQKTTSKYLCQFSRNCNNVNSKTLWMTWKQKATEHSCPSTGKFIIYNLYSSPKNFHWIMVVIWYVCVCFVCRYTCTHMHRLENVHGLVINPSSHIVSHRAFLNDSSHYNRQMTKP